MPKRVTVHDVAREADLSIASVSRALTGARPVTAEVAERVHAASERLGYRPNRVARSLRLGKTSSVGLILPDLASPFFPALSGALERELRAQDLSMLVMSAGNSIEWERSCIESLVERDIDALLISPMDHERSREGVEWAAERVPVVQIDRYASIDVTRVLTDARRTIELAVGDMIEHGCTRFAFVGATSGSSVARDRLDAYQAVMAQRAPDCIDNVVVGDFTFDFGRDAAARLPTRWPDIDGVVCANDLIALGVIQGLQHSGRTVPDDVAVSGCDDTFFSQLNNPAITSVAQPVDEMARVAVGALTGDPGSGDEAHLLEPELRRRGSTAHPR